MKTWLPFLFLFSHMKAWIYYDGKNQDNYDIAKDFFLYSLLVFNFAITWILFFLLESIMYYVILFIAKGSVCVKNNKQYKYSINTSVYEDMLLINVATLFQNKIHKVINET